MATITLPKLITPAIVHAVEAAMQRAYAELEQAELQHASADILDRLYAAYLQSYHAYHTALQRFGAGDLALPLAQRALFDPE